jgi:hypothetical protein
MFHWYICGAQANLERAYAVYILPQVQRHPSMERCLQCLHKINKKCMHRWRMLLSVCLY